MGIFYSIVAAAIALALMASAHAEPWGRHSDVDPITDSTWEYRVVEAHDWEGPLLGPPYLSLVCFDATELVDPGFIIAVDWGIILDVETDTRRMTIRFDDDPAVEEEVQLPGSRGFIHLDPTTEVHASRLLASEKFAAQFEGHAGGWLTAVFDTSGLASVIDGRFKRNCGHWFEGE